MWRLLVVTTGLIFILSLLVTATRFMGHTDDSPMVILENTYHCSPEPCWHDIRPGVTTWEQALKILRTDDKIINAGDAGPDLIYFNISWVFPELQGYLTETHDSNGAPTGGISELNRYSAGGLKNGRIMG